MDLNGRFDFWRMLLHTRAITPPRVMANFWSRAAQQSSVGWWALLAIAALSVGAALRLGVRDLPPKSEAVSSSSPIALSAPAKATLPW